MNRDSGPDRGDVRRIGKRHGQDQAQLVRRHPHPVDALKRALVDEDPPPRWAAVLVLVGIALLTSGFVGSTRGLLFGLAVVTGCVLWLLLYSYLVWRTDPEKISPSGMSPDDRE